MKLTPEEIEEFRALYEKAFGESLSYDIAEDKMEQLLELYRIILKLPPEPPPAAPPNSLPR